MKVAIRHTTTYHYDTPDGRVVQRLHLTPRDHAGQQVLEWAVEAPGIAGAVCFADGYGNVTHLMTPPQGLAEIAVTARGVVETEDRAGVVGETPGSLPLLAWLRQTEATRPSPAIRAIARAAARATGLEQLHALMAEVRAKVDYAVGATHAHTTAAEAVQEGRGVCQDHAQVFVSAARLLDIPARYVSGYMVAAEDQSAEASHAWAEAHVPRLGWVGFDAANLVCPDDTYVRVAVGLDARSAAPVLGVRRSRGQGERLTVEVLVQPARDQ